MNRLLIIGGTLIEPGQVREVHLPVTQAANSRPVILPITVIRGVKEGPCGYLTAAVHGDELNGIAILRNLISKVTPERLSGSLIIVPIVNMLGFLTGSRYLPDRRDLNRAFPGTPTGNMTQRIAYKFFHEVIQYADFGIDFHTASDDRENFPHLRGDLKNAAVKKLAKAFGNPIIIDERGPKNSLRYLATHRGIPSLLFEGGSPNTFQKSVVQAGVKGTVQFLRNMGMLKQKAVPEQDKLPFQIVVNKTKWIRADHGGLLELKTSPGGLLYRGDPIAIISNPLGQDAHIIPSPITGLVIGITTSPLASPGMPIVHMVELNKTLKIVEKHIRKNKLVL